MKMNLNQRIMALAVAGAVATGCGTPNHSTTPEEISIDKMVEQASTGTAKNDIMLAGVIEGRTQNPDHYRSVIDSIYIRNELYGFNFDWISKETSDLADNIKTNQGKRLFLKVASQKALEQAESKWGYLHTTGDKAYGDSAIVWFNRAKELSMQAGDTQGAYSVYQEMMDSVIGVSNGAPSRNLVDVQALFSYCKSLQEKPKANCFEATMKSAEAGRNYEVAQQAAERLSKTGKVTFYENMRKARDALPRR